MNNAEQNKFHLRDRHYLVIFLFPAIFALALFAFFPLIYSLRTSFFGYELLSPGSNKNFVGFLNYANVIRSIAFWEGAQVTIVYMFWSVTLAMLIGTAMAFLFYQNLFGSWIVRTVVISAMVISPVIIGTLWRLMYNPDFGLVSYLLEQIGIGRTSYLANTNTVLGAIILVDVWQWSPLVMVIVLAALQGMPHDSFEAGLIDGCTNFQLFVHITLPLIKPALLIALLIRTMDSFREFDKIYAMTGGGPGTRSQNLNILMYNTGFEFFQISKVSSMAILSLIVVLSICIVLVKIIQKGDASIW
jgi:multiple sugar transport system permease protein